MDKCFCTIKELSVYLEVSIPYIRKLIYARSIPFYRFGSNIRFDKKEVDKWVESHKQEERRSILLM